MTPSEAQAIISAFEEWAKANPPKAAKHDGNEGFLFYRHLVTSESLALGFKHRGPDKWQPIKALLRQRGLILGD